MKAPAFYKNRPSDVDLSNLSVIPDAPRVADTYPKNWDWKILEAGQSLLRGAKKIISGSTDSAFDNARESESTMKDLDGSGEVRSLCSLCRVTFCTGISSVCPNVWKRRCSCIFTLYFTIVLYTRLRGLPLVLTSTIIHALVTMGYIAGHRMVSRCKYVCRSPHPKFVTYKAERQVFSFCHFFSLLLLLLLFLLFLLESGKASRF